MAFLLRALLISLAWPATVAKITLPLRLVSYGPHNYYTLKVNVGTPPQTLNLAVTTGQPRLTVFDRYSVLRLPNSVNKFDSRKSTTFSWAKQTSSADYDESAGPYEFKAKHAVDTVRIDAWNLGMHLLSIVTRFADHRHFVNEFPDIDGFIGVGLGDHSTLQYSAIHDLAAQFSNRSFSLALRLNSSILVVDGVDEKRCGEWFTASSSASSLPLGVPAETFYDWNVFATKYTIGPKIHVLRKPERWSLNSEATKFGLSQQLLDVVLKQWEGNYSMPAPLSCSAVEEANKIVVPLGSGSIEIPAEWLEKDLCWLVYYYAHEQVILPQAFHEAYCLDFHIDKLEVRFAKANSQP